MSNSENNTNDMYQKERTENVLKIDNNGKTRKKEDKIMKSTTIIGVGNCGSQVAALAEKKYSSLFNTVYINTSDTDLSMVPATSTRFKIGTNKETKEIVDGSGKDREKMKDYLDAELDNILADDKFKEMLKTSKRCFIVASAAGGTGSGAGPFMYDFLRDMFPDTIFILVAVLPRLDASFSEHGNELEFLHELYEIIDNPVYMMYDNETTADMPATTGLTTVNECIVEDMRVLTGVDNFPTPYESIDGADLDTIESTPGRLLVARINKGLTEKNIEDNMLDDMIIKSIKSSCNAEIDRNKEVVRWGVITYFTEEVNSLYCSKLDKLAEFIGRPFERFNHNAVNKNKEELNFLYLIAVGLSPVNDRTMKTKDKMDELRAKMPNDAASKYILSGDTGSYSDISNRKRRYVREEKKADLDINTRLNKFRKK